MDNRWAVLLLSALLGGLPILPAFLNGGLPGVEHTDLIPAVWSIWAVFNDFPSFGHTNFLAYPSGMGWYPQSLTTLFFALPLQYCVSLVSAYSISLWMGRSLCFAFAYFAARAWNASESGAWFAAIAFGMSPILQGYAYEGVIEGVHAWPVALWLWMLAKRSPIGIAVSFFLCITASWYLAAVSCLLLLFCSKLEKSAYSIVGFGFAAPFVWSFLNAFPSQNPIPLVIRQAHAITLTPPTPFWLVESAPIFGQTAYLSIILLCTTLVVCRWKASMLLIPVILGLGLPIISELPILSAVRFPYRWQLGTTILAIMLLKKWLRSDVPKGMVLALLIEMIICSPFPPFFPTTMLDNTEISNKIDGPVLNLPNWIESEPGQRDPSKIRAVSIYSAQFSHGQPIMGTPSFNGLSQQKTQIPLSLLALDPEQGLSSAPIAAEDIKYLGRIGVRYLLIHRKLLSPSHSRQLQNQLDELNMVPVLKTSQHLIYKIEAHIEHP